MRWMTGNQLRTNEWVRRFAWIPRKIRTVGDKDEWAWLESYDEMIKDWQYLDGGYRIDLERRLTDGTHGEVRKYVVD